MAGLFLKNSGRLFLANNAQNWFIFDWNEGGTTANHWIRPSVNHNPFSSRQAQLRYVEERIFWDWDAQFPPGLGAVSPVVRRLGIRLHHHRRDSVTVRENLMRVYAAYEDDGRIVALSEIVEDGDERISVRIRPGDEGKVAELDVPQGFEESPFAELAERYRVDTGPGGPRFALR
jgi:hypothetical protein